MRESTHKDNINGFMPLSFEETLSPEEMFDGVIEELTKEKPQKEYTVYKCHLNRTTLSRVLAKRPKILIINCHGSENPISKKT